jgi:hypothetical protein
MTMDTTRRPLDPQEHDELAELALLSAVGALLPEEQRRVAAHLAEGCARCEAELAQGQEASELLALAAPTVEPSAGARAALLRAVDTETAVAPASVAGALAEAPGRHAPRRARSTPWAALAAGLALLLSSGALLEVLRQGQESRSALAAARGALEQSLAEQASRTDALAQQVGGVENSVASLQGSHVQEMTLGGEAKFGQATARVVMDAAGQQVLLLASRVPPLPAGQTYQLWVIISGTPRSLGVFTPDPEGRVVHVESESLTLASDAKVAVSVEPSGGVPQPTGPIVLISH